MTPYLTITNRPPTITHLHMFTPIWSTLSEKLTKFDSKAPTEKAKNIPDILESANTALAQITSTSSLSLHGNFAALETIRKILTALFCALVWCRAGANPEASTLVQHMRGCTGAEALNKVFSGLVLWQMDWLIFKDGGAWLEDLGVLAAEEEVGLVWGEVRRVWQSMIARKRVVLFEKEQREAEMREFRRIKEGGKRGGGRRGGW